MTKQVARFLREIGTWAASAGFVRAAVLIGSQARTDRPADEWSDVDVALLVDDPEALAADTSWLERFGAPELTFVTRTPGGDPERRVLFADGLEVDLVLLPASALDVVRREPAAQDLLRRGFRVLYSADGAGIPLLPPPAAPELDVAALATDFWYHALWTAKKLLRGEALAAREAVELHMKPQLVALARVHAERLQHVDTWHADRFAETWADPRALAALWAATSAPEELVAALELLCETFAALAAELGAATPERAPLRLAALLEPGLAAEDALDEEEARSAPV